MAMCRPSSAEPTAAAGDGGAPTQPGFAVPANRASLGRRAFLHLESESGRYLIVLDGQAADARRGFRAAVNRLRELLSRDIARGNPSDWTVSVRCHTDQSVALTYTSRPTGPGPAPTNECLIRAIETYRSGENNIHRALESAVRLLLDCCPDHA